MSKITKVYQHYAEEHYREHPQYFQKVKEFMDSITQPRLRF